MNVLYMSVMNVESLIFVTGLIHLRTIFINLIPIIQFLFHICQKYNTYEIDNEENKQKIMITAKNKQQKYAQHEKEEIKAKLEKKERRKGWKFE